LSPFFVRFPVPDPSFANRIREGPELDEMA
jgi:hypothetical protein